MSKVKVYNLNGEVVSEHELNPEVFGVAVKPELVQMVVEAQMANSRQVLAHTKGRSEVRGGGKKPWKQKGTGRARHGSIRSPLWRGGGITFGPTRERNFAKSINQKVKNKVLRMVLSDKAAYDHLILVNEISITEPKTKRVAEILKKLPIQGKSTMIVLDKKDDGFIRASRNLTKLVTCALTSLNVVDLLKNEYLITSVKGAEKIAKFYTPKNK
jgi:large subunit ribosomal protein L4